MRAVAFLLALDSVLALGFIIPFSVPVNATDALVITILPMITLVVGVIFHTLGAHRPTDSKKSSPKERLGRPLIGRIGNVIVLLSVLVFFLGMGIISGMTHAEKTYIPIISWFFPSVFLTGTQLFLLFMAMWLVLTLWALAHDLRERRNN